jgi:hypothetical protein
VPIILLLNYPTVMKNSTTSPTLVITSVAQFFGFLWQPLILLLLVTLKNHPSYISHFREPMKVLILFFCFQPILKWVALTNLRTINFLKWFSQTNYHNYSFFYKSDIIFQCFQSLNQPIFYYNEKVIIFPITTSQLHFVWIPFQKHLAFFLNLNLSIKSTKL